MKKFTMIVLSVLLAFGMTTVVTGCKKERDPNTLTVYIYQQESEQKIYEQLAQQFQDGIRASNPNFKVELQFQGGESYFTKLKASATAKELPDIIYVRPGDVRQYVKTGLVKNLSEMIETTETDGIWDNALNFFRFDTATDKNGTGSLYALPKDYSQYMLGFNQTHLKTVDLTPYLFKAGTSKNYDKQTYQVTGNATDYATWTGVPLDIYDIDGNKVRTDLVKLPGKPGEKVGGNHVVYTFEEFGHLAYLSTKRDNNNKVVTGNDRIMGTGMWEEMCLMAYVWGNGSEFLKDNYRTSNLTDPKFEEAYQHMLDLRYKYYSNNGAAENDPFTDFARGRLAICSVGTWDISYFAENFNHNNQKFELMPWPCTAEGDPTTGSVEDVLASRQNRWKARADSVGYGISRDCTNDKMALAFIKYLSTNTTVQQALANQGAQIPNLKSEAQNFVNGVGYTFVEGYPANRDLLIKVAETTMDADGNFTGNGHYGPSVYTYNDEWFSTGFLGEIGKTTATEGRMTAKEYCEYINGTVQEKLDAGWQSELDDAEGGGCGGAVVADAKTGAVAIAVFGLALAGLGALAARGKKSKKAE